MDSFCSRNLEHPQHLTHPNRSTIRSKSRNQKRAQHDSLHNTRIAQLLWSGFLMVTIGFPAGMSQGWVGTMVVTSLIINFVACITCFWNLRLGWFIGILFVSVVLTQQLWVNLTMTAGLVRGVEANPLGTTMLVAVNSALLIAPATLISLAYFIHRRRIADIMLPRSLARLAPNATTIHCDNGQSNSYRPPINNE